MAKEDQDESLPSWVEVLRRAPMQIMDDTDADGLSIEMSERLLALLESHNGLEPDAEGWRQLALELALKYEPAFQIETPVDRTGRSGKGGRPVGFGNFILRSRMMTKMRAGMSQAAAARAIAKESKGNVAEKTATNALSRKSQAPDEMQRWAYEWKADTAIRQAARKLSQE